MIGPAVWRYKQTGIRHTWDTSYGDYSWRLIMIGRLGEQYRRVALLAFPKAGKMIDVFDESDFASPADADDRVKDVMLRLESYLTELLL